MVGVKSEVGRQGSAVTFSMLRELQEGMDGGS